MSSIYVLEPPTRGKVVLSTTHGALDIELWPKEAPKAVRNFVQLCLEGYYDKTVFHRIIKSFIVQGGDPTGSGTGGESIYGNIFADEFHSRLRFNHRGLVACANAGSPHSNGSQFFMTLDRCDWLDKKHTIFGKVTGDSIFNLLRLGDAEIDKNDRPLDPPPRVLSVEVLWNPFDDIVPRKLRITALLSVSAGETERDHKKAVKKLNLLSFGEEAEEEEKELATMRGKIKSSHDALDDPRLLKEPLNKEEGVMDAKNKKDLQLSVREALSAKIDDGGQSHIADDHVLSDDDEARFDARMRSQILIKRKELGIVSSQKILATEKANVKDDEHSSRGKNLEHHGVKMEKLSLKKGIGSEAKIEQMARVNKDLQLLDQAEQGRQLHKEKKRRLQGRGDETMARLERFKQLLSAKPISQSSESEAGKEDLDWMVHRLKFVPDPSDKDSMNRKNDPDDYKVYDPLLEKGKEKFKKMEAKLKRREREWAGKSIT